MFNLLKRHEAKPSAIDPVIENLISEMAGYEATSDEYTKLAYNLKTIVEAKALEPQPKKIDPNTLAVIGANLAGIVMILIFEKTNIVTSKSLSMILKPRI